MMIYCGLIIFNSPKRGQMLFCLPRLIVYIYNNRYVYPSRFFIYYMQQTSVLEDVLHCLVFVNNSLL